MEDMDSLLTTLIQRTPLVDSLTEQIAFNEFFEPLLDPDRKVTQYVKASRLYDKIFYKSAKYTESDLEHLKQIFFDTGNGCAGELLFSTRPQRQSINFFDKKLAILRKIKSVQSPVATVLRRKVKDQDAQFFRAAISGNSGKLESLLLQRILESSILTPISDETGMEVSELEILLRRRRREYSTLMMRTLIEQRDWAQRTILHAAIYSKYASLSSCVNLLLEYAQSAGVKGTLLDCKDCFGNTPLHLAIRRRSLQMTRKLIMEGADIFVMDNRNNCPLQLIFQLLPKAGLYVMDVAVTISGDISWDSPSLNVDFASIISIVHFQKTLNVTEQVYEAKSRNSHAPRPDSDLPPLSYADGVARMVHLEIEAAKEAPNITKPEIKNEELRNFAYLLHNDKKASCQLSAHPVAKLFLHLKWNRLRRRFYKQIVARILFWLLYFWLIFRIYCVDCPSRMVEKDTKDSTLCNNTNEIKDQKWISNQDHFPCTLSYLALGLIPPTLLFGIARFYGPVWRLLSSATTEFKKSRFGYPYFDTALYVVILSFVPLTIVPPYFQESLHSYQYPLAVIGVLLGSVQLLHVLGESNLDCEIQSIYVYVYMRVLWRFISVILTFSSAFLGFAVSFSIIFSECNKFSTFSKQTLGLFIMIHGEFDFKETTLKTDSDEGNFVFWTAQVLFVLFGALVTLVLIDVFLGYTVSDIKELRDRAEDRRRFIQIDQMFLLEKSIISWNAGLGNWLATRLKLQRPPWLQVDDICVIKEQNRIQHRNDFVVGLEELPTTLQANFKKILFSEG